MWTGIAIAYLAGIVTGFVITLVFACITSSSNKRAQKLNESIEKDPPDPDKIKSSGPQPPNQSIKVALILIPLLVFMTGCLATSPPEPEIIERHCALVDLKEKPNVPAVDWIQNGELMCTDPENYFYLKRRESLIKTYANYCIRVYEGAQERCRK